MRYFELMTLGDDQDKTLAFIDEGPVNMGAHDYRLSCGESAHGFFPENAEIYLQDRSPGIKLASLLGNSENLLILNATMKMAIEVICEKSQWEAFPFTLYNHKKRIHSQDYWIINPLLVVDCVNRDASDIDCMENDPAEIIGVNKFVFNPDKLQGLPHLFRVPEELERIFVSEKLAHAWHERGCTNVFLEEISLSRDS